MKFSLRRIADICRICTGAASAYSGFLYFFLNNPPAGCAFLVAAYALLIAAFALDAAGDGK